MRIRVRFFDLPWAAGDVMKTWFKTVPRSESCSHSLLAQMQGHDASDTGLLEGFPTHCIRTRYIRSLHPVQLHPLTLHPVGCIRKTASGRPFQTASGRAASAHSASAHPYIRSLHPVKAASAPNCIRSMFPDFRIASGRK